MTALVSIGALADPPESSRRNDPAAPEPLAAFGVFGGAGYSGPLGMRRTMGFALSTKNLSLDSNDPGDLEAAALGYLYPYGQTSGSLYLYLGKGFLAEHALGIGPMIGVSEQTLAVLRKPAISAGGRICLELPRVAGLSLVPALAVVSNGLPIPLPLALLTLEIRYSVPAALTSPTR